VPDSAGKGFIR